MIGMRFPGAVGFLQARGVEMVIVQIPVCNSQWFRLCPVRIGHMFIWFRLSNRRPVSRLEPQMYLIGRSDFFFRLRHF